MLAPLPMFETDRSRGVGLLEVLKEAQPVRLPLAGVRISARVADRVAQVTVEETFENHFKEAMEAVYIFPLAGGCAVSAFEMKVKGRRVKGVVKERGQARREYAQAIQEGKRASIMEKERDDVFTVTVGNLPPGEQVTVTITYSERLPFFDEGATELRLPLVVAPRYIPGAPVDGDPTGDGTEPDTDAVPDASRITPPRLAKGFDPKVALGIDVELADSELSDLACSQHAVKTSLKGGAAKVSLALEGEPLDRDFVLRWRLAGAAVRKTCLAFRDGNDTYAMLSILPPRRDGFLGLARDVVFVLDRSGSMGGVKMSSAARACSILLHTLGPRDRFNILAFDDKVESMIDGNDLFASADESGLEKGDKFLREIDSRGGTEMDVAVAASLAILKKRRTISGRSAVLVLLTDGEVGDESRILARIQKDLGDARVFTVGIDTAVNDGFLTRLAAIGGGTSSFVVPGEKLEEALRAVGREIGQPVVTDLSVSGPVDKESISPAHVPDLFAGRASTAFFKVTGKGELKLKGKFADGKKYEETVSLTETPLPAIAHLWARARVAELEDKYRLEPNLQSDVKAEIVKISVRHTLLTRFTAFLAVDDAEIVNAGGENRHVVQPVEMPAKWEEKESLKTGWMGGAGGLQACSIAAPAGYAAPKQDADDLCESEAPEEKVADRFANIKALSRRKSCAPPPRPPASPAPVSSAPTPVPRPEKDAGRAGKPEPTVRPADRDAVARALEAFVQALATAKADLDAGRTPDANALEKARAALVKALAASALASSLPSLQRFLRTAALELVAACASPGAAATSLRPLFERHLPALEEAAKEAQSAMAGAKLGKDKLWWAFWEKSV